MEELLCKIKLISNKKLTTFKTLKVSKYGFLILKDLDIDF